eukprot:8851376-Alexandrium_andersonii.AAC.1
MCAPELVGEGARGEHAGERIKTERSTDRPRVGPSPMSVYGEARRVPSPPKQMAPAQTPLGRPLW